MTSRCTFGPCAGKAPCSVLLLHQPPVLGGKQLPVSKNSLKITLDRLTQKTVMAVAVAKEHRPLVTAKKLNYFQSDFDSHLSELLRPEARRWSTRQRPRTARPHTTGRRMPMCRS